MIHYFDELKKLDFPTDQFAICGSGPLAIRKLRKNQDIDIVVKEKLWKKLRKLYQPQKTNPSIIQIGHIEVCRDMLPWFEDTNALIDHAEIIEGFRFVNLKHTAQYKKKMKRPKDIKDIERITEYLMKKEKTHHEEKNTTRKNRTIKRQPSIKKISNKK